MRGFMPTGVVNKSVMTDEVIDLYLAPWSSEDGKRAFFRNLRRLNKEYTQAIAGALKQLPHPTLVLWGDRDPFQKPEYASRLATTIPNAELIWIKDAGHWLIDEKPAEIGAHLNTFLSQTHSNRRGGSGSTDTENNAAETFKPHEHGNKA